MCNYRDVLKSIQEEGLDEVKYKLVADTVLEDLDQTVQQVALATETCEGFVVYVMFNIAKEKNELRLVE